MDTQKVVVVLLIIAILFSVATIWKTAKTDTDELVPAGSNTVIHEKDANGEVGLTITERQEVGTGS